MKLVKANKLFDIFYGVNLDLNKLEEVDPKERNAIRYIGRSEKNNGITAFVLKDKKYTPNPSMTISVAAGGSVMSCFLQEDEYYSGRDLFYLKPKIKMNSHMGTFKVLNDVPTIQDKPVGTMVEKSPANFLFSDGFQVLSVTGDWQDTGTAKYQDNNALIKKSTLMVF